MNILFEQHDDIRTIYNIAVASFTILSASFLFSKYYQTGELLEWEILKGMFNKLDVLFNSWVRLFLLQLLIIQLTRWIHYYRPSHWIWVPLYLFSQFILYYLPYRSVTKHGFGLVSSLILLVEAVKISMKMHSYLRNKLLYASDIWKGYGTFIPKLYKQKGMTEADLYIPTMAFYPIAKEVKKYIYFIFAPTLLYRDKYVKVPGRDFSKILGHFVNMIFSFAYNLHPIHHLCATGLRRLRQNASRPFHLHLRSVYNYDAGSHVLSYALFRDLA